MRTITCVHCKASFEAKRKDAKYCSDNCRKALKRSSTKTTRKAKPLHECENCKKPTKNKRYCGRACQSLHAKEKRQREAVKNFPKTNFGKWLIESCVRAGTVQVLTGADYHSLSSLWKLHKGMVRANGIGNCRARIYELAHLSPVKGRDSVGLLSVSNLMITLRVINNHFGNKEFGHAGKIMNVDLLPCYKVDKDTDKKDVIRLINKLTKGAMHRFIRAQKIRLYTSSTVKSEYGEEPHSVAQVVSREVERLMFDVSLHDSRLQQELETIHLGYRSHQSVGEDGAVWDEIYPISESEAQDLQCRILTNSLSDYEVRRSQSSASELKSFRMLCDKSRPHSQCSEW